METMYNASKTSDEGCEGCPGVMIHDLISGSRDLKSNNWPRRNCGNYGEKIMYKVSSTLALTLSLSTKFRQQARQHYLRNCQLLDHMVEVVSICCYHAVSISEQTLGPIYQRDKRFWRNLGIVWSGWKSSRRSNQISKDYTQLETSPPP